MSREMPVVIFAGGKSSRMGDDKALLPFGEYATLSQYLYEKMRRSFRGVYLCAKSDKFPFDAPVILDKHAVYSPLSGLISALEFFDRNEAIFVLSVDTPFIDTHIVQTICDAYDQEQDDAAVATHKGHLQPLCGVYSRKLLPLLRQCMQKDEHKLGKILQEGNTKRVPFEETNAFLNLNRPEEYRQALNLLSS